MTTTWTAIGKTWTAELLMANTRPNGECLEWIGRPNSSGYGRLMIGGKQQLAHRLSWQFHFGRIPAGLCVLHRCDNPPCVNPAHLFLGTQIENIADRTAKGRTSRHRGELRHNAKLTNAAVVDIHLRRMRGESTRSIAALHAIPQTYVYVIVKGKSWPHMAPCG